jgi:hypothetical protein
LSKQRNAFLRLLKNKDFKEESMTKVGLYAIGISTTLESNKSLFDLPPGMAARLRQLWEETARRIAPDTTQERSLIEGGRKLLTFLEHTRLAAMDWQRDTSELLRHFEMSVSHVSLDSAQSIASLEPV